MGTVTQRRNRTIFEECVARGGTISGARVQTFISCWTMASKALDKPITVAEYRDWWRVSNGSAYRELARFRKAFPEFQTPQPIADHAIARADEWLDQGVKGFGQLPASLDRKSVV